LASDDFLLEPSTVFDFATSITLGAYCLLHKKKERKIGTRSFQRWRRSDEHEEEEDDS